MQVTIDLWLWRVTDPVSRRNYITSYRMAEPDALDLDPVAERIEGSLERRTFWIDPNVAGWQIAPAPKGQTNGMSPMSTARP